MTTTTTAPSGLILPGSVTPAGGAARAGVQGYDPKIHDQGFDALQGQLADEGFVTAALDDVITWARTG